MLRFSITTLGCKVNQYDGCAVAATLRRAGMQSASPSHSPELVVVNTCCVTAAAMRKSRNAVRRAVRRAPNAGVLVTGCYSDYDAERIGKLLAELGVHPRRAVVVGHHGDLGRSIRRLLACISARQGEPPPPASRLDGAADAATNDASPRPDGCAGSPALSDCPDTVRARRKIAVARGSRATAALGPVDRFDGRQRAFVKVQDGCDAFCTYCIVPYTRAVVWSRSIEEIHDECTGLVAAGHREIVLTGVFLGAFGRSTAVRRRWNGRGGALPALLARIAAIDGLWRVRLSSLEPQDVSDELLVVCGDTPNVAPHFHLPLQSGSARVLERMNRQYTPDQFRRAVDRVRGAMDRPAFTTDIIVGFPGEADADFADTLALARHVGFAKIHAFPFSPIKGTAAWARRGEAPPRDAVRSRLARLAELEAQTAGAYRRQFIGEEMEALVEARQIGPFRAMTDRYMKVRFGAATGADLAGKVVTLRIDDVTADGLSGTQVLS